MTHHSYSNSIHVNILLHAICFMSKTLEIFHWFLNKLQWSESYQNVFKFHAGLWKYCRSGMIRFFPGRALFWFHIWYWPYLMKKLYGTYHMARVNSQNILIYQIFSALLFEHFSRVILTQRKRWRPSFLRQVTP